MALGDGSLQMAASDAATASNIKVVSEGPAFWTNLMYRDALEDARGMGVIRTAAVGDIVQSMNDRSQATDAVATDRVINGNFLGGQLASLAAAVAQSGIYQKGLELTPPQVVVTKSA